MSSKQSKKRVVAISFDVLTFIGAIYLIVSISFYFSQERIEDSQFFTYLFVGIAVSIGCVRRLYRVVIHEEKNG